MLTRWRFFWLLAGLGWLLVGPAGAAATEANAGGSEAWITAEGVVKAVPDMASLRLTIQTEAAKAQQATAANARLADGLVAALKKQLQEGDSLKSIAYRVQPLYSQPEKGKKQAIIGYQARHTFLLRVHEPRRLGELLDLALQHGVNDIQGPWWEHSRLEELQREATVKALQQARQLAEALARSQQLQVKKLVKVSVTHRARAIPPGAVRTLAAPTAEAAATPIEVGEEEIRAQVEATFALE